MRPGDGVRVLLSDARTDTARITGVFDDVPLGSDEGEMKDPRPAVAFPAQAAAGALGPHYLRVELALAAGHDPATVLDKARRLVGEGPAIATGVNLAAAAEAEAQDDATDILTMLLPFAAVALLVGVFIIANTFTMLVTQRTRQFALLRAIGARRGQVRRASSSRLRCSVPWAGRSACWPGFRSLPRCCS